MAMATTCVRPRLLLTRLRNPDQRRHFLPNPFASSANPLSAQSQIQTLTASRTLPYPHLPIYAIISDLSSYPSFLPFCDSSTVTKWSAPDRTYRRRWPSEGIMTAGYKGVNASFTSRIFCVPGKVVESVGGLTETDLAERDIAHHFHGAQAIERGMGGEDEAGLLTHLRSRWTLDPKAGGGKTPQTAIRLDLEFAFANPFYATLSAGATPFVAEKMIKAFEERVREQLEGRPDLAKLTFADFGGSRPEE